MLRGIGIPYVKSLDIRSDLPPDPLYGSNWGHKIGDFVYLPYISFIIAFTSLKWVSYNESLDSWSDLPLDPLLWVKLGS